MRPRPGEPIAIVGAGIAGLSAALSLAHFGYAVEVFERAPVLEDVGAGLQLSPNALRILTRLGLTDILKDVAVEARTVTLRNGFTGRTIATVPVASPDGVPYLSVHRADLQRALLDAVNRTAAIEVRLGIGLVSCSPGESAAALRFASDRGTISRSVPLVVGADGVQSVMARSLGRPGAVPTKVMAWRSTVPVTNKMPGGIEAWLGPHRHAIAYPIRGGSEINLVLLMENLQTHSTRDGENKRTILDAFRRWDPRLRGLLERSEPLGTWPLQVSPRKRRWVFDRTACLIGDAVHAMLPYAAQGAAMAIEDGWVLAHSLHSCKFQSEALSGFETAREPRIRRVANRVALHAFAYHLPRPFDLLRDAALRRRSPASLRRSLAWLYDWCPPDS